MNKKLIKKIKTDKHLVKELRRSHLIIVILAIGVGLLVGVLIKGSIITQLLGIVTITLDALVGLISIFVIIKLSR